MATVSGIAMLLGWPRVAARAARCPSQPRADVGGSVKWSRPLRHAHVDLPLFCSPPPFYSSSSSSPLLAACTVHIVIVESENNREEYF